MASFKSHPLLIVAALIVLLLVNLTATAGLLWLIEEGWPEPRATFLRNQLHQIGFGILLSQVILIGYWLGLGGGRWYLRLVAAIALTLSTAMAIHFGVALSPTARHSGSEDPWAILGFILIAMMLTVSFMGFVLRRTRGWRLTWHQSVNHSAIHQFQIADGLLWMVVIGGALAAMRFVVSIEEDMRDQFLNISLMTVRMAAVVLAAMMTAFATTRRIRTVFLLVVFVTAIGVAFAVPDIYRGVQRARPSSRDRSLGAFIFRMQ